MKTKKIFACYPSTYPQEFLGVLQPTPVTTILYRPKKGIVTAPFRSYSIEHVEVKWITRLTSGKFGNEEIPNIFDYIYHTIRIILNLGTILKHDAVLFITPPFFDCIIIPLMKAANKQIYTVVMDAQYEVALNFSRKLTLFHKIYYYFASLLENYSVKNSDKVFAVSKYLYDKYSPLNKNIFLIPNGADVDDIAAIKGKRLFDEFTITYMGGFESYRGIELLIDAFRLFKLQNNRNMHKKPVLLLIGTGPDFDQIKKYANNDKDIKFAGVLQHDKAIAYCKGSDVLVMPSRNSLSSKTISSIKCFEYIACEIPCIVTNTGDHAYFVKKYKAGMVVRDNANEIASAITKLSSNKKLYSQIVSNCRKAKKHIDYRIFKSVFRKAVLE